MSGLSSIEIKLAYKKGRRIDSKHFIFYVLESETLKVSPVVSKKISKKAVIRNKIKRRVRVLANDFLTKNHIVVIVKKDVSNLNFRELENEFEKIASKIN